MPCYWIKTPMLWFAGHYFVLVQTLPFWPYPVRWIQQSSFGKETYRNRCATRFNICSFIICYIYVNDIQTVSEHLNFILYTDDTTLASTLCTFTQEVNHDVNHMSYLSILDLLWIFYCLAVNKLSLNVDKKNPWFFIATKMWYQLTISLV